MSHCSKSTNPENQHEYVLKQVELQNYVTGHTEQKTISICRFCSKGLLSDYNHETTMKNIDCSYKCDILNIPHVHEWTRYIGKSHDNYHTIRCKDINCNYIIKICATSN
jgi:hypothetical protein